MDSAEFFPGEGGSPVALLRPYRDAVLRHPLYNAVEFRHVSVQFGGLSILDDVNASVPAGSCTVIVGPNGAGKTTLLLTLLGEVRHSGLILTRTSAAENAGKRALRVGYVPQRISIDRGMPLTVTEFLAMGEQRSPLWLGVRPKIRNRALELLERVQAAHLAGRRLGALSGGETQRVLLALALQREPELLVLDEPSAGVDFQGEHLFCELLEELRAVQGFTQVMVSHDLGMVAHHATHVICLKRQVTAEGPPAKVLTGEVLNSLFGMHMGIIHSGADVSSCPECSGVPAEGKKQSGESGEKTAYEDNSASRDVVTPKASPHV